MPNDAPDWNSSPSTQQAVSVPTNTTLKIPVTGFAVLILQVTTFSPSGTTVAVSADGVNFVSIDFYQLTPGPAVRLSAAGGSILANAIYAIPVAGMAAVLLTNPAGGSTLVGTARSENGPINLGLLGQLVMASSYPVVLASDHAPFGVKAATFNTTGTSAPATGSQAKVILASTPGKTWTAAHLSASIAQTAAAAGTSDVQLLDGASVIWTFNLGVDTAPKPGSSFTESDLAIIGTPGNSMTFQNAAGVAGWAERVNIGAYLK